MSNEPAAVPVRPAREEDFPAGAEDLRHALATDPDGVFAAGEAARPPLGLAAGVARGETLSIIHLDVAPRARGRGVGGALFAALRSYGASRGTRAIEFAREGDAAALGFLLGAGLPVRGLALRLRARTAVAARGPAPTLHPVPAGAPLSGWVAALDRETRGFARTPDWTCWTRRGTELFSSRRGGRPEGIGGLTFEGGRALLGPVEAATPAAAAELLLALAAEARGRQAAELLVTLPGEARLPLQAALSAGFRLAGTFPLLGGRWRGDPRRYTASGTAFF